MKTFLMLALAATLLSGCGESKAPKSGMHETFYRSGAVRRQVEFKDHVQNGMTREFYESGQLKSEVFYKDGVPHGAHIKYSEEGFPLITMEYEDGKQIRVIEHEKIVSSEAWAKKAKEEVSWAPHTLPPAGANEAVESAPPRKELLVADFNSGEKPTNLGGDFGAWDKDPTDATQISTMTFDDSEDALNEGAGFALRIEYDVDSPHPAYNGIWIKLNGLDVSGYTTLSFFIKGDADAGYPSRIKFELKDARQSSAGYVLSGITEVWRHVKIPLNKFKNIQDWTALDEFVMVFQDTQSRPKTGVVYLDHISFVSS